MSNQTTLSRLRSFGGDADRSRPSLVAEDRRVIPSDSEHQINLGGTRRAMLPFCSV